MGLPTADGPTESGPQTTDYGPRTIDNVQQARGLRPDPRAAARRRDHRAGAVWLVVLDSRLFKQALIGVCPGVLLPRGLMGPSSSFVQSPCYCPKTPITLRTSGRKRPVQAGSGQFFFHERLCHEGDLCQNLLFVQADLNKRERRDGTTGPRNHETTDWSAENLSSYQACATQGGSH